LARIQELRDESFHDLRRQITEELHGSIMLGLQSGLNYSAARRAIVLMSRLGVYKYEETIRKEIQDLEGRFGCDFEQIIDAIFSAQVEADFRDEEEEQRIAELARAAQERGKHLSG